MVHAVVVVGIVVGAVVEHALAPAAEYFPTAHAPVQVDAERPVELPYRPAAHAVHWLDAVRPVLEEYRPVLHAVHWAEVVRPVEADQRPARHAEHWDDEERPVEDEKRPAGQPLVTAERPVVAQYEPALQESQLLEPVEGSNLPAGQDVHDEAPADEYLPTAHDPVTDDRPAVVQYEPSLQESQLLDPVEGSNLPDGQDEQLDAPADENLPTAHDPVTAD